MHAFGEVLQSKAKEFLNDIQNARENLEKLNLDSFSIQESISAIVYVQEIITKEPHLMADFKELDASNKLLKKQRYAFSKEWISIEYIESEMVRFWN